MVIQLECVYYDSKVRTFFYGDLLDCSWSQYQNSEEFLVFPFCISKQQEHLSLQGLLSSVVNVLHNFVLLSIH